MEPLPIGSGNRQGVAWWGMARQGFNGATANRQWELGRPKGSLSVWTCFNGATANRQWEPRR